MRTRTIVVLSVLLTVAAVGYWFTKGRSATLVGIVKPASQPVPASAASRVPAPPARATPSTPISARSDDPSVPARTVTATSPQAVALVAAAVAAPNVPVAPAASPLELPTEQEVALAKENSAATNRMIQTHASLRAATVANPDSAENQRILQTMIAKAVSQPASLPPQSRSN